MSLLLSTDRLIATRAKSIWLFTVAFMVVAMVVIGGMTRLTDSGLSMTSWKPVTGFIPPLNQAEWQEAFTDYKASPEYTHYNQDFTLSDFKKIFWWEFFHRVWGRLIGLVFIGGLLLFALSGRLAINEIPSLAGLLCLGGIQGFLGWWMVKSGLVDRPDVSHFRLAVHFGMALFLFLMLVKKGLDYHYAPKYKARFYKGFYTRCNFGPAMVLLLLFSTSIIGSLMAGLKGGLIYNSFPLMDGYVVPPELYESSTAWYNSGVIWQWLHRIFAIISFFVIGHVTLSSKHLSRASVMLFLCVLTQVILGIINIVWVVPLSSAILHQFFAVMCLLVWIVWFYRMQITKQYYLYR